MQISHLIKKIPKKKKISIQKFLKIFLNIIVNDHRCNNKDKQHFQFRDFMYSSIQ